MHSDDFAPSVYMLNVRDLHVSLLHADTSSLFCIWLHVWHIIRNVLWRQHDSKMADSIPGQQLRPADFSHGWVYYLYLCFSHCDMPCVKFGFALIHSGERHLIFNLTHPPLLPIKCQNWPTVHRPSAFALEQIRVKCCWCHKQRDYWWGQRQAF